MADLPELVAPQDHLRNSDTTYHQPQRPSAFYTPQSPSQPHAFSDDKEVVTHQGGDTEPNGSSRLRGRTFWGLVILAIAIIAAAVGGGIGGALAVQHAKAKLTSSGSAQSEESSVPKLTATVTVVASSTASSPSGSSSTASVTPSGSFPADPASVERVDISCPNSTMVSWHGESFSCLETTQVSPSISTDVTGIVAYTLQTCIDACSTWNQLHGGGCKAVSMEWDLSYAYQAFKGANCFLRGTDSPTSSNPNVTSLILS